MKFFTLENYRAAYDDDDPEDWKTFKRACDASLAYLQELRVRYPSNVWEIAEPFFVDDALVAKVRFDRKMQRMEIVLRCGNLLTAYFDLVFRYEGVEISHESEFALATVARATKTCRLFWGHHCYVHELDLLADGRFVHHFLFHPGLCITILSSSLSWERIPRPDRKLPRSKDRFPGGPPTPPPSIDAFD